MQNFFLHSWEILINTFEALLFFVLISNKLSEKKHITHIKKKETICLLFLILLLSIFNFNNVSTLFIIPFFFFLHLIFALYFFSSPIFFQIFWITLYSILCIFSDMITMIIPSTFSNVNLQEAFKGGAFRIQTTIIYIVLLSVFIFILIAFTNKKIFLSPIQKVIFVILSLASIFAAQYLLLIALKISQNYHLVELGNNLKSICFLFTGLFLSLLIFIYLLGVSKQQNINLLNEKAQRNLEQRQFENILESTQELRNLKHDISNHLDTIEVLANSKNTEELLGYLKNYRNHINDIHQLLTTGNTAIDCILSSKLSIAKKEHIQVIYSLLLPEIFPIDDVTLCSLIGNIFDNAIESCEKLSDISTNKYIQFIIKPHKNMLSISIKNGSNGEYTWDNAHNLLSSKKRKTQISNYQHGLGLKRVKKIVEDADGIIQINAEKNYFFLCIMLPLK